MNNRRIVEIREGVLSKNDQMAQSLRASFDQYGVFVVNLVSGPGSGKTELLEQTLRLLQKDGYRPAALVGDMATENDAIRLARSGAPVRQIVTADICHLEANMIAEHLEGWALDDIDFLFIENVGNLVCPASYDLGENLRVVLLSVTEGEDKPQKYPAIFNSANAVLLTKTDLATVVEFDFAAAIGSIKAVAPHATILATSARDGEGLSAWLKLLLKLREPQAAAK